MHSAHLMQLLGPSSRALAATIHHALIRGWSSVPSDPHAFTLLLQQINRATNLASLHQLLQQGSRSAILQPAHINAILQKAAQHASRADSKQQLQALLDALETASRMKNGAVKELHSSAAHSHQHRPPAPRPASSANKSTPHTAPPQLQDLPADPATAQPVTPTTTLTTASSQDALHQALIRVTALCALQAHTSRMLQLAVNSLLKADVEQLAASCPAEALLAGLQTCQGLPEVHVASSLTAKLSLALTQQARAGQCSPAQLVTALDVAAAAAHGTQQQLLEAVGWQLHTQPRSFSLAQVLAVLQKVGTAMAAPDARLFEAAADVVMQHVDEVDEEAATQLLSSYAARGYFQPKLFHTLCDLAVSRGFTLPAALRLLSACAHVGHVHEALLDQATVSIKRQWKAQGPNAPPPDQLLAATSTLHALRVKDDHLWTVLARCTLPYLQQSPTQPLAADALLTVAEAHAAMRSPNTALGNHLAETGLRMLAPGMTTQPAGSATRPADAVTGTSSQLSSPAWVARLVLAVTQVSLGGGTTSSTTSKQNSPATSQHAQHAPSPPDGGAASDPGARTVQEQLLQVAEQIVLASEDRLSPTTAGQLLQAVTALGAQGRQTRLVRRCLTDAQQGVQELVTQLQSNRLDAQQVAHLHPGPPAHFVSSFARAQAALPHQPPPNIISKQGILQQASMPPAHQQQAQAQDAALPETSQASPASSADVAHTSLPPSSESTSTTATTSPPSGTATTSPPSGTATTSPPSGTATPPSPDSTSLSPDHHHHHLNDGTQSSFNDSDPSPSIASTASTSTASSVTPMPLGKSGFLVQQQQGQQAISFKDEPQPRADLLASTLQGLVGLARGLACLPAAHIPTALRAAIPSAISELLQQEHTREVQEEAQLLLLAGGDPTYVHVMLSAGAGVQQGRAAPWRVTEPWAAQVAHALACLQPEGGPANSPAAAAARLLLDWLGRERLMLSLACLSADERVAMLAHCMKLSAGDHPVVVRLRSEMLTVKGTDYWRLLQTLDQLGVHDAAVVQGAVQDRLHHLAQAVARYNPASKPSVDNIHGSLRQVVEMMVWAANQQQRVPEHLARQVTHALLPHVPPALDSSSAVNATGDGITASSPTTSSMQVSSSTVTTTSTTSTTKQTAGSTAAAYERPVLSLDQVVSLLSSLSHLDCRQLLVTWLSASEGLIRDAARTQQLRVDAGQAVTAALSRVGLKAAGELQRVLDQLAGEPPAADTAQVLNRLAHNLLQSRSVQVLQQHSPATQTPAGPEMQQASALSRDDADDDVFEVAQRVKALFVVGTDAEGAEADEMQQLVADEVVEVVVARPTAPTQPALTWMPPAASAFALRRGTALPTWEGAAPVMTSRFKQAGAVQRSTPLNPYQCLQVLTTGSKLLGHVEFRDAVSRHVFMCTLQLVHEAVQELELNPPYVQYGSPVTGQLADALLAVCEKKVNLDEPGSMQTRAACLLADALLNSARHRSLQALTNHQLMQLLRVLTEQGTFKHPGLLHALAVELCARMPEPTAPTAASDLTSTVTASAHVLISDTQGVPSAGHVLASRVNHMQAAGSSSSTAQAALPPRHAVMGPDMLVQADVLRKERAYMKGCPQPVPLSQALYAAGLLRSEGLDVAPLLDALRLPTPVQSSSWAGAERGDDAQQALSAVNQVAKDVECEIQSKANVHALPSIQEMCSWANHVMAVLTSEPAVQWMKETDQLTAPGVLASLLSSPAGPRGAQSPVVTATTPADREGAGPAGAALHVPHVLTCPVDVRMASTLHHYLKSVKAGRDVQAAPNLLKCWTALWVVGCRDARLGRMVVGAVQQAVEAAQQDNMQLHGGMLTDSFLYAAEECAQAVPVWAAMVQAAMYESEAVCGQLAAVSKKAVRQRQQLKRAQEAARQQVQLVTGQLQGLAQQVVLHAWLLPTQHLQQCITALDALLPAALSLPGAGQVSAVESKQLLRLKTACEGLKAVVAGQAQLARALPTAGDPDPTVQKPYVVKLHPVQAVQCTSRALHATSAASENGVKVRATRGMVVNAASNLPAAHVSPVVLSAAVWPGQHILNAVMAAVTSMNAPAARAEGGPQHKEEEQAQPQAEPSQQQQLGDVSVAWKCRHAELLLVSAAHLTSALALFSSHHKIATSAHHHGPTKLPDDSHDSTPSHKTPVLPEALQEWLSGLVSSYTRDVKSIAADVRSDVLQPLPAQTLTYLIALADACVYLNVARAADLVRCIASLSEVCQSRGVQLPADSRALLTSLLLRVQLDGTQQG